MTSHQKALNNMRQEARKVFPETSQKEFNFQNLGFQPPDSKKMYRCYFEAAS